MSHPWMIQNWTVSPKRSASNGPGRRRYLPVLATTLYPADGGRITHRLTRGQRIRAEAELINGMFPKKKIVQLYRRHNINLIDRPIAF